MKPLLVIFVAILVVGNSYAQEFLPTPEKWVPQDGERVVFLGDSITHQCLYTQYVENWVALRYPDRTVHFRNAGVGGDRTVNLPARFDRDVAAFEPTHVFILLGMNDGGYLPFNQQRFDEYRNGMTMLIERIHILGAKPILLSPTLFDSRIAASRGDVEADTIEHYPGVLQLYGTWLAGVADRHGLLFADLFSPMAEATREGRRDDPMFTLASDAVHPEPIGHRIIAETIIDSVFADPGPVSVLEISMKKATDSVGGTVSEFSASEDEITFSHLAKSLPTPSSKETLSLSGLPVDSTWELQIDGIAIGQWTGTELAHSVSLRSNRDTPQAQQAASVMALNQKRTLKQMDIRNWWQQKKIRDWAVYEWGLQNPDATPEEIATHRAPHDEWLKTFDEAQPLLDKMSAGIWEDVMKNAQPKPRHYRFRRILENGL